jgi:hypothetical protein
MKPFAKNLVDESRQILIQKGLVSLLLVLKQYLEKEIELVRIVRVSVLLMKSGTDKQNEIFQEIRNRCLLQQKGDGGWIGVEDSVWCVDFLKELKYSKESTLGLEWLRKQQLESGGWGNSIRDLGRIPITGILLYLLPELSNKVSLEWLETEWKKEYSLNPKLTYKGAFTLMALKSCDFNFSDPALFNDTVDWLASQQNDDFGWGPYKGHPVGSTPFCTAVALMGLLQCPNRIHHNVIANGLNWIEKNQLENGLWSDHYIEEGSAWSFYALTEGYKFLKGRK